MGSLARNTYYNISAFGINTLLSLATITLLVRGYGVDGYGVIILARMLLPNGVLGLLEAGFPEVTCRSVAAARATGDLKLIGPRVSAASIMAAGIGSVAALGLWFLDDVIVEVVFHSADISRTALVNLVIVSAVSLPLQLAGSVIRGALEGSERFPLVRSVEVLSNLSYLVIVAILLTSDSTSVDAALAYVWIWNTRSALYILIVCLRRGGDVSFGSHRIWSGTADFLAHAFQLFSGKLFSLSLNFGPSIVLGVIANAGSVGTYEIVMRIPRVLKTVSGMFNGALLPFAARSDALGESDSAKRVVEQGTTVVVGVVATLSVPVVVLSPDVLHFWLGLTDPELSDYLRIALLWPVLVATIGIGSSMLLSRPSAAASINKLSMVTTLCYFAIAVGLYPWLAWRSFVIALIVSQAVTLPAYWRLQVRQYEIDLAVWLTFFGRLALVVALATLLSIWIRHVAPVDSIAMLVAHGLFVAIAVATSVTLFALPRTLRELNAAFIRASFHRLRG